jgi:hypothetical protein
MDTAVPPLPARRLIREPEHAPDIVPAQGVTLLAAVLYALISGGVLVAGA